MPRLLYRCYAKVNLTLEVLRRRDDGYHELASLVHTISLADDLRIDDSEEMVVRVEGLEPAPQPNLVATAAALLAARARVRSCAELTLLKRIPGAAGLGGGSSDAATTLVGLDRLWGTQLGEPRLVALAAELGSDVPFFIRGGAAVLHGRGDRLRPVRPLDRQYLVLVVPPSGVPNKTATLYAALKRSDFTSGEATDRAAAQLDQGLALDDSVVGLNAFERAARARFAGLGKLWDVLEDTCGRPFHLSGSGPSVFALARDRADAQQQAGRVAELGVPAHVVHTVYHARVVV